MRRLRFGLVAVFATMLVVIGVAGWIRAELDLYREEQALIAEFAKAGCQTHIVRGELDSLTLYKRQQAGGGYTWYEPEWLTRMTSLSIVGDPPEALLRRAVALPTLQALRVSPTDPMKPRDLMEAAASLPAFPPSAEILGRKLPEFQESSIDASALVAELPDGEAIEGAERDAILESMRKVWTRDVSELPAYYLNRAPGLPSRFVKRIEAVGPDYGLPIDPAGMKIDLIRDGDRYWSVQRTGLPDYVENRLLTLRNDEGEYGLTFRDGKWRFCQRADAEVDPAWAQHMALMRSPNDLPRPYIFENFPHATILDHVARLSKIDENRVRLEVEPFNVDVTRNPAFPHAFDVERMTLVVRAEMDWAVSAERSRVTVVSGATRQPPTDYVAERTFERRDGYVLPIEEVRGIQSFSAPGVVRPMIGSAGEPPEDFDTIRTRYAWELNPELDPAVFDPNHYLAEPLAPRTRPFPWYYVPLAIGGGGVAFLIIRSVYRLFQRLGRSKNPDPAAAEG